MLPNGIIGHLYGPFEGYQNDNFLLSESGLLEHLKVFAHPEDVVDDAPVEEQYYQIFGDPAYGVGHHISSPFQEWVSVQRRRSGMLGCQQFGLRWNMALELLLTHGLFLMLVGRCVFIPYLLGDVIAKALPNTQ